MNIRLPIGGVFASKDGAVISTLLGSCVAACLYDPVRAIGGMNHIWLPGQKESSCQTRTVFGFPSMELLLDEMMKLGASKHAMRAKVFGGAALLRLGHEGMPGVGKLNCRFVLRFLKYERIPIEAYRLGGTQAVSVEFHTGTGKAKVHCVPDHHLSMQPHANLHPPRIFRASKHSGEDSSIEEGVLVL